MSDTTAGRPWSARMPALRLLASRGGHTTHGARDGSTSRHECPGMCGRDVANRHHSCRHCWPKLPAHVRNALNVTAGQPPTGLRAMALTAAAAHYQETRRG